MMFYFQLVMDYGLRHPFPCDKRGPTAQTPYSRDLAGSPMLRPGVSHPSSLGEKDIISKKIIYFYLLGASEGGMLCLKAH